MRRFRLPRQITKLSRLVLLAGCTVGHTAYAEQTPAPDNTNVATFSSPLSYQIYNILAAEMYVHGNKPGQAALHYIAAAQQANSVSLAQRAAELASNANDPQLTDRALELWTKIDPSSLEARQYHALSNVRAGNYDQAVADLIAVRDQAEKKNGKGFDLVISLLALESDGSRAYETLKRFVAKADSSPRAQLALAAVANDSGHFDEGLTAAQQAKQAGDKLQKEQASRRIAEALMGLNQQDKAIAELAPVAKNTKDMEIKLSYGRMLIMLDRRAEATPLYQQLYAKQPDNTDILYTLALLHLEQKAFTVAEPLMKKLREIPERAGDASYFLGQIYEGEKRPQDAVEAYKRAVQGSSFIIEASGRTASLLLETSNLDTARQWLQAQVKTARDDVRKAQFQVLEGKLLYEKEKYAEAAAVFDQVLAVKAEDADALYNRSLCKDHLGDIAAAEADLRALLKIQPENATVLNALGYMLVMRSQRYPEAEELIRKAVKLRPTDPAIMDSMGWVLFRTGKLDESEDWLRKSYAQLHDPEIAGHLVEVLSQHGKAAEAKQILQEILGKFPHDSALIKLKDTLVGL